ncbi:hypothetical protein HDU96_006711, partial [Phlyctochytrium bullatum]
KNAATDQINSIVFAGDDTERRLRKSERLGNLAFDANRHGFSCLALQPDEDAALLLSATELCPGGKATGASVGLPKRPLRMEEDWLLASEASAS